MKNEKGPLSWLTQFLNKHKNQKDKKPSLYVYVFIIVLLGMGIMMVSNLFTANQPEQNEKLQSVFNNKEEPKDAEVFGQKNESEFKTTREYEVYLQNEMKEALEMIAGVSYERIDDQGLHIKVKGKSRLLPVDNVVICAGQEPDRALADLLITNGIKTHVIGGADVAAELDAKRAINQGSRLAAQL